MGKRPLVRLAAAAAGGLLALAVAGPAFAVDHTVSLQEDHKNTTAPGFDEHKCDGIFEAKGDDEDGWHFLLNQFLGSVSDVKAYSLSFTDQNGDPVNINLDNIGTHQFQKTGPVGVASPTSSTTDPAGTDRVGAPDGAPTPLSRVPGVGAAVPTAADLGRSSDCRRRQDLTITTVSRVTP
ncbi:MAG: hypothetical protein FWJ70_00535 [Micromonosporaceae bacterium]